MRNPTLVEGDRHQSPIPVVLDSAGRARQRVLALSLPIAAALYISAEAVNPRGTDQPITSRATALKELPIAVHHPAQLFVSGSLTFLALGALAVSYAAIATLVRNRGSAMATIAALIGGIGAFCGALVNVLVGYNLAAAATAHMSPSSAAGQPQPGAGRRAREQPVKMSRHSPAVSQALRLLESVKARA
jgi:MFS family permease